MEKGNYFTKFPLLLLLIQTSKNIWNVVLVEYIKCSKKILIFDKIRKEKNLGNYIMEN